MCLYWINIKPDVHYRQFNKEIDKMEGKNLTFLYSQADTTQDVLKINNN